MYNLVIEMLLCVCLYVCSLQFVFQSPLISALDLIDRGNVTLLTSPSGRQVFRVSVSQPLNIFFRILSSILLFICCLVHCYHILW